MSLDLARPSEQPLTSTDDLVEYFRSAERPRHQHKVGLEHEKLVYPAAGSRPVPYEGRSGIGALLEALEPNGYSPFREAAGSPRIALVRDQASVSLEPGGQLEMSGSPFPTARQAHRENLAHVAEVEAACARLGLRVVTLGYRPFDTVASIPWMPKSRYRAMRQTLGARGGLALDMMLMTATGQVSLDWADEADCTRKVTTVARLSPLMVALYANSPLVDGRPSGLLSYRSHVWTDVDPARCGTMPFLLDGTFSYRAYVEWALDAPLLFLRRDGKYLTPKLTFRQYMQDGFEGRPADLADWIDHISTLFPEVRIKRVLEVRGADCASAALTGALAALWRGILGEPLALDEAEQLLARLTLEDHRALQLAARRSGLRGRVGALEISRLAQEFVEIARRGLGRLDPEDAPLLEPLAEVAASGRSPAERVLERWERDPDPVKLLAGSPP